MLHIGMIEESDSFGNI